MNQKSLKKVLKYLDKVAQQEEFEDIVEESSEEPSEEEKTETSVEEAREVGERLGIDWESSPFPPEEFAKGIEVEYEHGKADSETNVTNDDLEATAKIAWAHLKESPEYYILLAEMEKKFATKD